MGIRFRVLGSGSTGNMTLIEGGGARVVIDAGLGPREMAERLQSAGVDPTSVDLVLLSHEHNDHARGAASFSKKWGVRLAGTRGTYAAGGFGAFEIAGWDVLEPASARAVRGLSVTPVAIPHDAAGPIAFVVSCDGRSLGHVTDCGHLNRGLVDGLRGCHAVLVESNYDAAMLRDGPYPWSLKQRILGPHGHLSNDDVARWLGHHLGEECRTVVLAHLSQKNNHPEVARMAAETSLRRRGRTEVRLEITGPEGTDWLDVAAAEAPAPKGPRQLRLF